MYSPVTTKKIHINYSTYTVLNFEGMGSGDEPDTVTNASKGQASTYSSLVRGGRGSVSGGQVRGDERGASR
jgi:hypothetical protein